MNPEYISNFPLLYFASASVIFLFVCIGIIFFKLKQLHSDQERTQSVNKLLQSSLDRITEELREAHEYRKLTEVQLKTIRVRQRQIDLRDPQAIPYNHAITMVKRGAEEMDLISSCGLTQGEAELIIAIHGNNQ